MKYPLVKDTIDKEDIDSLIVWLQTYPRLTKGPLTKQLENEWATWVGTERAVYVNSGSSANLLMLYALILQGKLSAGDEVIVPAISWATDLAPVIQLGLKPILCDCNMSDLSVSLTHMSKIIKENDPKALMLVSVLGLVPEMDSLVQLCSENNITLLEDVCESLGSRFNDRKLGTFGSMSSFSLYFGHHISTIEGGMICTDDHETADLLLSIRNHGWDRDWDESKQKDFREKYGVQGFDALYKFYYPGFNVRATDLQAQIGFAQLQKLNKVCEIRERNFQCYLHNLQRSGLWLPKNDSNTFISNFCFPIIHKKRNDIAKALIAADVECRPLIAGSMGTQPMYTDRYGVLNLENATKIDEMGMYVPNNQAMKPADVEFICSIITDITLR